ncbi:hypothetical protein KM043_006763 [Ampulex compressa]|nr:hypothetical protein KM043_006763 [Ampulex compressa]
MEDREEHPSAVFGPKSLLGSSQPPPVSSDREKKRIILASIRRPRPFVGRDFDGQLRERTCATIPESSAPSILIIPSVRAGGYRYSTFSGGAAKSASPGPGPILTPARSDSGDKAKARRLEAREKGERQKERQGGGALLGESGAQVPV